MAKENNQSDGLGTILIDTSYLLPIFGAKIDLIEFEKAFPILLRRSVLVYSPLSLIEAKWIILRMSRNAVKKQKVDGGFRMDFLSAYSRGLSFLESQRDSPRRVDEFTSPNIESIADELMTQFGITDYFDRMIYAVASQNSFVLLTEDERLHELDRKRRSFSASLSKPRRLISWKQLRPNIRGTALSNGD